MNVKLKWIPLFLASSVAIIGCGRNEEDRDYHHHHFREYHHYHKDGNIVKVQDRWYGPGYYYGTWFDSPDDYWNWRNDHLDYPPNRKFYNREQPTYYRGQ